MGYSTNPETLEKIRPRLSELEAGNPCRWRTSPGQANLFRYKILEALYIARMHSTRYPKLAQAASKFSIRVISDTLVAAESKSHFEIQSIEVLPGEAPVALESVPEINATEPLAPLSPLDASGVHQSTHPGFQTEFAIIDTWSHSPGARTLYFPDAALTTLQLTRLFKWAQSQTPPLMILTEDTGAGLTLATHDPEVSDFAWKPDAL